LCGDSRSCSKSFKIGNKKAFNFISENLMKDTSGAEVIPFEEEESALQIVGFMDNGRS
jgi:hypothetical protein